MGGALEIIIGILLIISFIGLAFYCVKGHNLMIGFLVMAILWTILPVAGNVLSGNYDTAKFATVGAYIINVMQSVFQKGPEGWGQTLVNVLWGAWFGRVMLETGIAATLIRKTVELGGDRPLITIVLLDIVTTVIFTSMTGAGPVIAIGVIILPILFSLGVPKAIAMFTFMGSVAAGIFINPVNFVQYQTMFDTSNLFPKLAGSDHVYEWSSYLPFAITALLVMLVVTIVSTAMAMNKSKTVHAWAAQTAPAQKKSQNVPGYSLLTPIIPVVLYIGFNFPVIGGFIIAGFFALFATGRMSNGFKANCQLINKMYYDGVVDTAPLIGFLLTLPMFNAAAGYAAPYFKAIIGGLIPKSVLLVCIIFAVLAIGGLFRGPLTLVGCGAATLGVMGALGFSPLILYPLFAIPTITMNIGSCITQSWVAWGLAYSKVEGKDFLKLSIPNGYIISGVLSMVVYFFFQSGIIR